MRAVTRYFETKRQQYLDNLPQRKEATEKKLKDKILTSRRRRRYVQRMKVANEAERERLSEIDHNYMSDEEDGDEEGIWVVRSPSWRSAELSSLLEALQKKVKEKDSTSKHLKNKRMRGANCTRKLPSRPPAWAVSQQRQTPIRQPTAPQHHNSTTASTLRDLENGGRPSLSRKNPQPLTRKRNRPKHPQETRTQDMEDEDSSCRSSSPKSPFLKGKGAHDSDEEDEEYETYSSEEESEEEFAREGEFSKDESSDAEVREDRHIKKKKLSFSQVQQELALPDPKTPEQMPGAFKTSTPIAGRRQNSKKTKKK